MQHGDKIIFWFCCDLTFLPVRKVSENGAQQADSLFFFPSFSIPPLKKRFQNYFNDVRSALDQR